MMVRATRWALSLAVVLPLIFLAGSESPVSVQAHQPQAPQSESEVLVLAAGAVNKAAEAINKAAEALSKAADAMKAMAEASRSSADIAALTQAIQQLHQRLEAIEETSEKTMKELDMFHQMAMNNLGQILQTVQKLEKSATAQPVPPGEQAAIPNPPEGYVALKLAWEYQDFPGEILAFEPPQGAKLWETASYEKGKEVPKGAAIKDGVVFLKPGEEKLVEFVYQNPMNHPVKFWVVPHVVDPMSLMPKTILKCLCTGQRYEVPTGGSWSRVISVHITKDVQPGTKLKATHVAVKEE